MDFQKFLSIFMTAVLIFVEMLASTTSQCSPAAQRKGLCHDPPLVIVYTQDFDGLQLIESKHTCFAEVFQKI